MRIRLGVESVDEVIRLQPVCGIHGENTAGVGERKIPSLGNANKGHRQRNNLF